MKTITFKFDHNENFALPIVGKVTVAPEIEGGDPTEESVVAAEADSSIEAPFIEVDIKDSSTTNISIYINNFKFDVFGTGNFRRQLSNDCRLFAGDTVGITVSGYKSAHGTIKLIY